MTKIHQFCQVVARWGCSRRLFKRIPISEMILILLAILIVPLVLGCSKDLTREEAAAKISDLLKSQNARLFGSDITGGPIDSNVYGYFIPSEYLKNDAEVMKLQADGFIAIVSSGPSNTFVRFTDKAKPFLKNGGNKYLEDFLIGTFDSVQVTGIGKDTEVTRKVECTIKFKSTPFTPLLKNLDNLTQQRTFNFRKFDDGWRVDTQRK